MDPNLLLSELSKLRDVTQPDAIGLWPPAPGWWLFVIILLASILWLSYLLLKYKRQRKWLKQARLELDLIKQAYLKTPNREKLSDLNKLLKRCYASVQQERAYLNQTGSAWAHSLVNIKRKNLPILLNEDVMLLTQGLYQANPDTLSAEAFERFEQWLNHLR